jgi:hypothetical protein
MMKNLAFTIAAASALAACGRAEADPQPDPRQVELLVASLDVEPTPPPEVQEKLAKADRIVTAVDRSEPDRLAGAAERLLAQ